MGRNSSHLPSGEGLSFSNLLERAIALRRGMYESLDLGTRWQIFNLECQHSWIRLYNYIRKILVTSIYRPVLLIHGMLGSCAAVCRCHSRQTPDLVFRVLPNALCSLNFLSILPCSTSLGFFQKRFVTVSPRSLQHLHRTNVGRPKCCLSLFGPSG